MDERPAKRTFHPPIDGEVRRAIQLAHLNEGASQAALARRFKVDRGTVVRALKGEDFDQLELEVFGERKREALRTLKTVMVASATDHWAKTFPKASKKGNHKPMEDALKAAGVIEETDEPRIVVQVGVKLSGHPE